MDTSDRPLDLLTRKVLEFQRLSNTKNLIKSEEKQLKQFQIELLDTTMLIAYRYPVTIRLLKEEEASEFLLKIYRRLPRIIREFRYEHLSFESYLKKVVFWQAGSFLQRKRKHENLCPCDPNDPEIIERIITGSKQGNISYRYDCNYRDVAWDSLIAESTQEYEPWDLSSLLCRKVADKIRTSKTFKKRMLQLVLLCADSLDSYQITILSKLLSINEKELAVLITKAIEKSNRRMEIDESLRTIRDTHYYEVLRLQGQLSMLYSVNADSYYIEQVQQRLEKAKRHYVQKYEESKARPGIVTHNVVASLLSIPKGTVDSGMLALRKMLQQLMDDTL
ncbi:MAG: hypothetical protein PHU24_05335 [Sphaerochaetaceae bacterium]|jgi:hypothetical protein|nr:hypothetical protein [Sphaerochaetaceae bacterium]NLO59665.1 hypothetical protein [Spirochaetales bacterium]MDD2405860.1 hypothetical protein [Sphaerochaetaceae bacterium]MDD3669768.1 hypothetical protein [Sphaerochaetaceae bacterium]MDD4259184.1 hypothetical protein [Sphaerochaetaceae bacterium]